MENDAKVLYDIHDIPLSADGIYCPFCGDGWHGEKPRELRKQLFRHLSDGQHDDKIASYRPLRLRTITGPYRPSGEYAG